MKRGGESSACLVTQATSVTQNSSGLPTSNSNNTKRGPPKSKDNLWCNYCKWKGHIEETCWKLHGQPPQVHMTTQTHLPPHLGQFNHIETPGGQQWVSPYVPPMQPPIVTPQVQLNPNDIQELREEMQQMKNLLQSSSSSGSTIGSTSLENSGKTPINHVYHQYLILIIALGS